MKRFVDAMSGFYIPRLNADDGSNGSGGGSGGGGEEGEEGSGGKTFTQAELDEIVAKRLKREKEKQAEYEAKLARLAELEAQEEQRKKDAMTEKERLEAEKAEAERKAAEASEAATKAQEAANKRIVETEIRSVARALNAIDIGDILSFVDRGTVTIDDAGQVVGAEEAVKALKEAKPYLFKAPVGADAGGGGNPHRNPDKSELTAKEAELAELKKKAAKDKRLLGKVTALYNEILALKSKK